MNEDDGGKRGRSFIDPVIDTATPILSSSMHHAMMPMPTPVPFDV
jgi:hypothetical protein